MVVRAGSSQMYINTESLLLSAMIVSSLLSVYQRRCLFLETYQLLPSHNQRVQYVFAMECLVSLYSTVVGKRHLGCRVLRMHTLL